MNESNPNQKKIHIEKESSNKDNLYISGSGANTIKINTSSGDVQIKVEK